MNWHIMRHIPRQQKSPGVVTGAWTLKTNSKQSSAKKPGYSRCKPFRQHIHMAANWTDIIGQSLGLWKDAILVIIGIEKQMSTNWFTTERENTLNRQVAKLAKTLI
jgi:hypothetical protein